MRAKLLGGAAALALTGCAVLASVSPAAAQWYDDGWGRPWAYGPGAFAADVIGGTVAAATAPLWAPGLYDYYPGYAYGPAYAAPGYYDYVPGYTYAPAPAYAAPPPAYEPAPPYTAPAPAYAAPGTEVVQSTASSDTVSSCQARFRSYNPATGMYKGYDGREHPCP